MSGSKIFLRYDATIPESPTEITFGSIDMIVFAKPTRVAEFILRDTFIYRHDMYNSWQGTLEGIQYIKGWPAWGGTFTVYASTDGIFKSEGNNTEKLNQL